MMKRRRFGWGLGALLLGLGPVTPVAAQRSDEASADAARGAASDSAVVAGLAVRSIGPAVMSGRVVDIAVASTPGARGGALGTVVYVAAATGGVWKSTNGGTSWTPIFDEAGVGSVGAIAVAPSNANVIWVGTGEANNMRSSSYGDGVYRSVDGGQSFTHMGLRTSQHVGGMAIHPDREDVVFVAAVGPLWGPGGERGLFKTTDGGVTWRNVLSIDEHTGVTDVVFEPGNPEVMYAATLQRERRAYSYVGGGPGSGIYRSTGGGETWIRLTAGLPAGDVGRIGLDVSRSHPATVYAVVEGSEGGVYRSDDRGGLWHRASRIASIPWYFGQIRVDPVDPDVVYHLGVRLQRSTDGGRTWQAVPGRVHSDQHALWINPENRRHLILGNDGGLWVSRDFGDTWDFSPNLPISQFYAVGFDMQEPFFGVYGGLQDNQTWGGPSRTRNAMGIVNADWYRMAGGDGFYAAVDPTDHTIAYVESQNGNLVRFNGRTGERKGIRPPPVPGEPPYRFNWSAPIRISPFDPATIYFAANYLFRSRDRGDSWDRLGPDLTRAIDRDSLPMMGQVPARDAVARHSGTAVFGNIATIDLSPRRPGLLATGADDGMIAVSVDDGKSWRRYTDFPGVPDTTYVSRVLWSRHDDATLYATFDGHRSNDFRPYVLRSTDQGEHWTSIASNLPAFGSVRSIAEHPRNPNLLFVGTEVGAFVSVDGGKSWVRIRKGLPPVPVHDLAVHPRDNVLVIATHGRGLYLIDDLGPLEHLADARTAGPVTLFPVAPTLEYIPNVAPTPGTSADRNFSAPNPPVAAVIWYLVQKAPGGALRLEILGPDGAVVRKLTAPTSVGLHRVTWDLHSERPWSGPPATDRVANRDPGQRFRGGGAPQRGAMVVPGRYRARLTVGEVADSTGPVTFEQPVEIRKDDHIRLSDAELERLYVLRRRVGELGATLHMALRNADRIRRQVTEATTAMKRIEAPEALTATADTLKQDVDSIIRVLRGRPRGRGAPNPTRPVPAPSVQQRLATAMGITRVTALPTRAELDALESVPDVLAREVERLNELVSVRMPAFFRALDASGVPWTPGRPIRPGESGG